MDRFQETNKVGIIGIIGNAFLLVIKGIVGYFSHSQAMIADTINSASDIFSSLMTYIGNRIAREPKDQEHNFGHGKAEYIFSFLMSIIMLYLAVITGYNSLMAIIEEKHLTYSIFLIIVSIITILTKLTMYLIAKRAYNKTNNILIKSNMLDHRNDIFITLSTLIAFILSKYNLYLIDSIVGILIALWIFITGKKLFVESYNVLMDSSIDGNSKKEIIKLIKKNNPKVIIDEIYTIPVGYKYIIVLTINIDGKLTTYESHEIADNIEKTLENNFANISKVLVHINPL